MLFSEKKERARRFGLALRMGIPLLLLLGVLLFYFFRNNTFAIHDIDIVVLSAIFLIFVYFLFFLINIGQSEILVDRITGAFDRHALLNEMKHYLKRREQGTLILLRIENLADINDHYGIDKGDRILRLFLHLLDEFLKLNDMKEVIIGKYHGGDFILLVPIGKESAIALMNEFIQTYKEVGGVEIETRFSVEEIHRGEKSEPLINHLYDMLYQKNAQKEKTKKLDIGQLEHEIVEAVREKNLLLHYVPTLHLQNDTIDLFEVGVRLRTKNTGMLPPKKFIPVINRLGMEREFDEALFTLICKDAKEVDSSIRFSFNISPHSLRNESFVEMIKEIAAKGGIAYDRIILELFENRAVKDIKRYKVVLEDLKELGVRFALDNFGASNASFDYIKKLPVDMVQFDREFTLGYNNPHIEALLKGYILACHQMSVETLVKWVDTPEALARFRELDVDYVQGFIVAEKPLKSDELKSKYGVKQ